MRFLWLVLLVGCAQAVAQEATEVGLRVQDEGVTKGRGIDTLNVVGAGATLTAAGRKATVTIPGGGGTGTPGGVAGNIQVNDGAGAFGAYPGTSCAANQYMNALDASGVKTCAQVATTQLSGTITDAQLANNYSGVGACAAGRFASTLNDNASPTCTQVAYADVSGTPAIPADISGASYITKVAEGSLSNEFALGSLGTGLLRNTTTTGVPVIYGGTSCTNQFPRSLDASGAATCAGVSLTTDTTANQGTTTTVLHGNAAGQPSFAAVSLTADVSGITPLANGGTNANLTADNGAIPYSSASAFALLAHGTAGQALFSGGAGAPTWGSVWQFLGTATGATVTVGPITWTATTRYVMCSYQIINYNGGTPVGRFLMGTASISTTARTNSYAISEGVTAPTTAAGATATPGIPLAVTLSNVGRMGNIFIDGQSGQVKTINVLGQNQTPAVATVPTIFQGASFFSDLGTNLAITRAQLTVYDTLTAIAASSQTFTSGTRLTCWGRDIT